MKNFPRAYANLAIPIALFVLVSSARAADSPATAAPSPPVLHLTLPVTLSASPAPSAVPFAGSPKVGDGSQITLTATLPPPIMAAFPSPQYVFTAVLKPSGETFLLPNQPNQANKAVWAPPKGGDYNFKVVVTQGPHVGSATVNNYHVRPSVAPTVSANPYAATVTVSANPPVMSLPGAFTISAKVSPLPSALAPPHLPGTPPAITGNYYWFFAALESATPEIWNGPIFRLASSPAEWSPSPQLTPGRYVIKVYVQTYLHNVLVAEGFSTINAYATDFYRGMYIVLEPPGSCPPTTTPPDPTVAFGWQNQFTIENSLGLPVTAPQGSAQCKIAGYNISDIVSKAQLRVRKINVSCTNCHQDLMAGPGGRDWLCNYALPWSFPHHKDSKDPEYPPDNSEDTLFKLLTNWWTRGCPD